jgi:hypothetical protein
MLARIGLDDAANAMGKAAMTRSLALAATALLAAWLCACGGSSAKPSTAASTSARAATTSASTPTATTTAASKKPPAVPPAGLDSSVDADKDNDVGAASDDANNNSQLLEFGHEASPAETRAVTALIKRYYATALAGDGARGCTLLYSTLAEAAPEDDGREADAPAFSRGATSCAEVLDDLFRYYHAQLAAEVPQLAVTHVRLEEHHGFAYLSFGKLPERRISVQREGHVWKLSQIYDEELQ